MSADHLDNELSVSADLTPTGIKARAKSRALSAFDRLLGAGFERLSIHLEMKNAEERALGLARQKFIAALNEKKLGLLETDANFLAEALENDARSSVRRQVNKDAVAVAAIQDLRDQPPDEEATNSGPDTLSPDFLNRFERYAEDATDDQLRLKWGRILASEIRMPGTFSSKVMRVADELDVSIARLFEEVCSHRFDSQIPCCLVTLPFMSRMRLVSAGLMIEPGVTGHLRVFDQGPVEAGVFWTLAIGRNRLAIPGDCVLPIGVAWQESPLVRDPKGRAAMPVYILTDEGAAISKILPDNSGDVRARYGAALSAACSPSPVYEYEPIEGGGWRMLKSV